MLAILASGPIPGKANHWKGNLIVSAPESSFNDGTTQNGTRPPIRGAGSHHTKRLVYGGLGLGLTLSEKAEGLEGSEWLLAILVGFGAIIIKELGITGSV